MKKRNNSAGGMGAKITPSAVLVIQNGVTRLVNIKNQDTLTRLLDMVPDVVNKFTAPKYKEDKDVDEAVTPSFPERKRKRPMPETDPVACDCLKRRMKKSRAA